MCRMRPKRFGELLDDSSQARIEALTEGEAAMDGDGDGDGPAFQPHIDTSVTTVTFDFPGDVDKDHVQAWCGFPLCSFYY